MAYLLGVDIGTSGTKTVLFDEAGRVKASNTVEYPLYQVKNGWAEQEPSDWWDAACRTIKDVIVKSGIDPSDIAGVGLSGQMHGLVMLDKKGEVLRRSIIWCDQRTAAECDDITSLVGPKRLIDITANPALPGFTASKILWVRKNEPDIYERCAHILLPKDYIRYELTGEFATEVSDASGMQLLDVPNRCWSEEVLDRLGIDGNMLGRVYESPEITGRITPRASELTGLAVGTPVVGGAGDNAAAAVGTGVVRDRRSFTTIGTSGVVFAHTSKISIDPGGRVHTFCCAVPGEWHVMGVTQAAGLSLQWFRNNFCSEEMFKAGADNIDPYIIMDNEAAEIPIGCDRLLYLPYLMGERTPHLDSDCRGVFFGLSAMHTRAHLIRAVMEGVAFSMRDCMELLRSMFIDIDVMMACGGGGRSALWRQMLADVYHCPVCTANTKEGPALGVAILAGVGTGVYSSVQDACDSIIGRDLVCNPNEGDGDVYDQYYQIYRSLYTDLYDDYKMLSKL